MMYLTRAIISYEVAAKAGIRDSYDWHQKVWAAFPGREGVTRDFLTRVDEKDEGLQLLILSAERPVRPPWAPDAGEAAWATRAIAEEYFKHRRYRFRLLANPTRKIASDKAGNLTKNGRRVPVTARGELLEWLRRKGDAGGFRFDPAQIKTTPRPRRYFLKEREGRHGLHHAVEFDGTLEVVDPAAFAETFRRGIGSAKGFGFGLLAAVPVE